jgi:hypothetical protein
MRPDIVPGGILPDYALPDHTGTVRTLSEVQGSDPLIPQTFVLNPGLVIHSVYYAYWFWGHPSVDDPSAGSATGDERDPARTGIWVPTPATAHPFHGWERARRNVFDDRRLLPVQRTHVPGLGPGPEEFERGTCHVRRDVRWRPGLRRGDLAGAGPLGRASLGRRAPTPVGCV